MPKAKVVGKYLVGKTIGEGTFGKVKLSVNTETGERVAIKVLEKARIQAQDMHYQIKKEISIMKIVKHSNVVQMHEVLSSKTRIFIVLELVSGGELFDKIVRQRRFSEVAARAYFRQLMRGVKYCHGVGVYHRDLKVSQSMNPARKIRTKPPPHSPSPHCAFPPAREPSSRCLRHLKNLRLWTIRPIHRVRNRGG